MRGPSSAVSPALVRSAFAAVLCVWVAVAAVQPPDDAQDIVPFLAAGEVVGSDPGAVYVDSDMGLYDLHPAFRAASCERLTGIDCEEHAVAFVSPPPILSILVPAAELPKDLLVRALRVLFSLALVAGMAIIWSRLSGRGESAPLMLLLTAVALTPFAMQPIQLGQSSPFMFLSAALGITVASRSASWAAGAGGLWLVNVLTKATPVLLWPLLLWQRRWRLAAITGGTVLILFVVSIAIGGTELVGGFLASSEAVQRDSAFSPFSGAFESVVHQVSGITDLGMLNAVGLGLRLLVLAGLVWVVVRVRDHDLQWGVAWCAVVLLAPLMWWHYAWALVGALALVLWRADPTGRLTWVLPAAAVTTLPVTMAVDRGTISSLVILAWVAAVSAVCVGLSWRSPGRLPASDTADAS